MSQTEGIFKLAVGSEPDNAFESIETKEIIDGFLTGDIQKTGALIELYYKSLYLNCLKLTRNSDVSEDLTQEAFIRAFKYKNTYNKSFKFSNWLLKISTNVCMRYFNNHGRELKKTIYIESLDEHVKSFYQLNNLLKKGEIPFDEKIENDIVSCAVNLLPFIYRAVLVLRYYNELTYEEISDVLKKPVGTVKFRLSRAKDLLGKLLESSMKN